MNRPQGITTTTPGEGPALATPLHTSHLNNRQSSALPQEETEDQAQ